MAIRYYWFLDGEVVGRRQRLRVARTGYTGEVTVLKFMSSPAHADKPVGKIDPKPAERRSESNPAASAPATRCASKQPCRLLRRTKSVLPSRLFDAGLGWIVKMDKGDFIGRDALVRQREKGVTRALAGFEMRGRGIARDGYEVLIDGSPAGWVTSGSPAPTLNRNIGLCLIPAHRARPGEKIGILIRNQAVEAEIVPTPFYKRKKPKEESRVVA